jgi:hypothetical protein
MKTKLLIILFLFTLCAFFAACSCSATGEREIIRDMYTSREGILSNGRKFIFYGTDQVSITLEEFLEERELFYLRTRDFIIQEETIEEMLERPEMHFNIDHVEPEWADIIAYYFAESNDVLFMVELDNDYVFRWGPLSVMIVNHESGAVSIYNEGWSH